MAGAGCNSANDTIGIAQVDDVAGQGDIAGGDLEAAAMAGIEVDGRRGAEGLAHQTNRAAPRSLDQAAAFDGHAEIAGPSGPAITVDGDPASGAINGSAAPCDEYAKVVVAGSPGRRCH